MATPPVEYLENHRRSARAQAGCSAGVASVAGEFEATTEDIGAHGCRILAPRLVRTGEPVQLVLSHPGLLSPLRTSGTIAWTTEATPWRLGIAFDRARHAESSRWFSQMVSVATLSTSQRVPDRIPLLAAVYLGAPPRFILDVTSLEMTVLREIGTGASIAEIMARLPGQRSLKERALFSLLAQRLLTLSRGASVHPNAWSAVLGPHDPVRPQQVVARGEAGRPATPRDRPSAAPGFPRSGMIAARAPGGPEAGRARWSPLVVPMLPPERWSRR